MYGLVSSGVVNTFLFSVQYKADTIYNICQGLVNSVNYRMCAIISRSRFEAALVHFVDFEF